MWEVGHGRDAHIRRALRVQRFTCNGDKSRINADSGGVAHWRFRLMTQRDHFFICVVIIQGSQVHQFQRAQAACG
ncbi:hypothetical protein D3C80_1928790 [compost metagenome]